MRLVLLLAALAAASPAWADPPDRCEGFGDLRSRPDLSVAQVVGEAPRVPFVRGADGANGCPNATDACRDRAYLVPGDQVIAGAVGRGFTCVNYVGAKGGDRAGWVSSANVRRQPTPAAEGAGWNGTWKRPEAVIEIKSAGGGRTRIEGSATFGAADPDRVRRGAVNTGEFEADVVASGAEVAFDVADKGTLAVDKGEEGDCKVWMRRLGPYLLVDDDGACGGMGVTFHGIYRSR